MKKSMKIISVLLLTIMLVTVTTTCFATNIDGIQFGTGTSQVTSDLKDKVENIIATLRSVAVLVAVVVIIVLGIKYMLGSVEEKADYKKSFVPLVIGIVVVVGALQIAAFIFNIVK